MPYTTSHALLRAEGSLGASATAETFSFGWRIPTSGLNPPTTTDLEDFLAALETPLKNFFTGAAISAGGQAAVRALSVAILGIDGRYTGDGAQTTTRLVFTTPAFGVGSGSTPWSTAVAVSHKTAIARGRGSRGRIFVPALGLAPDQDTGSYTVSQQTNYNTAAKTFYDAINTQAASHLGSTVGIAVMSSVGAGTTQKVLTISMGRRPDRQERRENSVQENYSFVSLSSAALEIEQMKEARLW